MTHREQPINLLALNGSAARLVMALNKTLNGVLMFTHVMVGSSNLERSRRFYDAVFSALGVGPGSVDRHRIFWRFPAGEFGASLPINGESQTVGNGCTVGFEGDSRQKVDAWHAAGVDNGGTSCEDPPGVRQVMSRQLYLAYLRDPDGNKLCANTAFQNAEEKS